MSSSAASTTSTASTASTSTSASTISRIPQEFANGPLIDSSEVVFESKLGSGVYGDVFLCKCRNYHVAVKMLKKKSSTNAPGVQAFLRELKIVQRLFHPNICLYMGYAVECLFFFFVFLLVFLNTFVQFENKPR